MAAFSTADDIVINRKIDVTLFSTTTKDNIEDLYEIPRCAKWITSNGYERVGIIMTRPILQCRKYLLCYGMFEIID